MGSQPDECVLGKFILGRVGLVEVSWKLVWSVHRKAARYWSVAHRHSPEWNRLGYSSEFGQGLARALEDVSRRVVRQRPRDFFQGNGNGPRYSNYCSLRNRVSVRCVCDEIEAGSSRCNCGWLRICAWYKDGRVEREAVVGSQPVECVLGKFILGRVGLVEVCRQLVCSVHRELTLKKRVVQRQSSIWNRSRLPNDFLKKRAICLKFVRWVSRGQNKRVWNHFFLWLDNKPARIRKRIASAECKPY